jgi:hypothetical protein
MHPDEIGVAGGGFHKIADRLAQPATECEGKLRTTVTHALPDPYHPARAL